MKILNWVIGTNIKIMKYTITIFVFILINLKYVLADPLIENFVKEGSRQYQQLIEYNANNAQLGCNEKNWYVFSFNPDDNWLELSNNGADADGNSLYDPLNLQEVNDLLVSFNQNTQTQLYICIVSDWKVGLKPYHPEELIRNDDPSIKVKDLLLEFSSDDKRAFRDSIQLRFKTILNGILQNTHQNNNYSLFTEENRVVWGISEFRAKFFLGQDKLSGGVIEGWASLPSDLNNVTDKVELFDYIRFVKGHRSYDEFNSRESKVRHHVEGFTEYISGILDDSYVPITDQFSFESIHYIPWETIPEHLKSHDGGEAFDGAVAVAAAEILLKKAENLNVGLLEDTDNHKFIVNSVTTNFNELSSKKMLQLDDKCAYLAHKSGLEFYVYFKRVDFLMQPPEYNVFANRVFVDAGLSQLENGAVLLCLPYFMPGEDILNVDGLNLTDVPSVMPGIAYTNDKMGPEFSTEINGVLSEGGILWDFMKIAFKHTLKPHRIHGATLMLGNFREENYAARFFMEDMTPPDQPELVAGFFNMNDLYLYKDQRIQTVRDLEAEKLTACLSELELSGEISSLCDDLAEQIEAVYQSEPNGFDLVDYDFQVKEKFLDPEIPNLWQSGEFLAKYAALEFKVETALLPDWVIEFSDLEDEGIVYNVGFFDLVYDPLDAASLIPGIGEVADGIILLVGISEVIFGEDTQRGLMAAGSSGLGLFLIGDNYIEVPLKHGKKLFVGPSIGFVTKDAIAQGVDPVKVQKLFGLADAGPGSTAQMLVNNTVSDGRRVHQVILENDKLFDHIRVMPQTERHAFLLELADNPNLVEGVFDNAAVTMTPVALWRKVNTLEAPVKSAIQDLEDADKIIFYQHLDQYGNSFFDFISNHHEEVDALGAWLSFRDDLIALGINETGIQKAKKLLGDLNNDVVLINHFKDRPTFVVAWDVLHGQGEDALIPLRSNLVNLDIVDEYLYEYPERLEDVQVDYILSEEKQDYIFALLGPGQPGEYVKHRVRGLYENIYPEDHLNGVLDDVEINVNSITTEVQAQEGSVNGVFERGYDAAQNMFIFKAGFRRDAPNWLDNGQVPLKVDKGIPTQMLVSLRQMKMLNIPDGSLTKAKMDMIQNVETMIHVTHILMENGYDDLAEVGNLILNVPSVQYAISTLKQAGYRISNATLADRPSTTTMTIQSAINNLLVDEPITQEFLDQFGFDWDTQVVVNFDVFFDLEAF